MSLLSRPKLLLLLCWLSFSGCVRVGPNFQPQHESWGENWNSTAIQQAGETHAQPDAQQWWKVFADPTLERLISEGDAHNAGVPIAGLRVMEARAQLGIAQSGHYPQVQVINGDARLRDRRESGGQNPQSKTFWQYRAGFDMGWELDFWGRFSRAIESADAAWFASQANYEDVLVLLHAQMAQSYYALRTAEGRLRIARDNARLQKRSYEITERLFKSGESDELDFQQAKTQYLCTLSSIPELESQISSTRNALAILIGRPPGPLPELSENQGTIPLISRAVLQDVPANLLLRRPDIRAAEQQIAAQSARPCSAARRRFSSGAHSACSCICGCAFCGFCCSACSSRANFMASTRRVIPPVSG